MSDVPRSSARRTASDRFDGPKPTPIRSNTVSFFISLCLSDVIGRCQREAACERRGEAREMRCGEYVANGDIETGLACRFDEAHDGERCRACCEEIVVRREGFAIEEFAPDGRERLRFAGLIVLFALFVRWLRRDTRHAFERGFTRVEDFLRRVRELFD